jgi:hydroxyacylglutathione hydrolase
VESLERIGVAELHGRIDGVQVLDVRERSEWDRGHIAQAVHAPYHELSALPEGLDPSRPIAAICSSGQRSAIAASLLRRLGAEQVIHVADGGVGTWEQHGWPLSR